MSSRFDLPQLIPAWLELSRRADVSLGLEVAEAFARANDLLGRLRDHQASPGEWTPNIENVEVLHALAALACREPEGQPDDALRDLEVAFRFIATLPWPANEYGGPGELLSRCALSGWRAARRFANPPVVKTWVERVLPNSDLQIAAERALSVPPSERTSQAHELGLDDRDLLLCVCEVLRSRLETTPSLVREEAEYFYRFVDKPERQIGLHDEREYNLGELALIAGTANRVLFRIDDAKIWLQRAEANLALTQNANAHWARVAYQRMALAVEERRFDEVLTLIPLWTRSFLRLEMPEDAIKCQFLEGAVQWELGNVDRATEINEKICVDAQALSSERLVAQATVNLVRFKAASGETEQALGYAQKALAILSRLGNKVPLVKLQWSMGDLLRKQRKVAAALEAYRQAQAEAREIGMRGDLAALHLIVADLLLDGGQEAQAEWEIRAALPIIDEEKMVPEGIAALSLLRESLRRQQIDRHALRDLHGYFKDLPR